MPHHFYSILAADCIEGESVYARCARRAYSDAQKSDKCLAGENIAAECQKLFVRDYQNEFRKFFLAVKNTEAISELRLIIASTSNVPEGIAFFLGVLENAENFSEDHADYSIMGIRTLLQRGGVENPIADRILSALLSSVKRKASYRYQVQDVLLMLLKNRDIDTQKHFVKSAENLSKDLATDLQQGLRM